MALPAKTFTSYDAPLYMPLRQMALSFHSMFPHRGWEVLLHVPHQPESSSTRTSTDTFGSTNLGCIFIRHSHRWPHFFRLLALHTPGNVGFHSPTGATPLCLKGWSPPKLQKLLGKVRTPHANIGLAHLLQNLLPLDELNSLPESFEFMLLPQKEVCLTILHTQLVRCESAYAHTPLERWYLWFHIQPTLHPYTDTQPRIAPVTDTETTHPTEIEPRILPHHYHFTPLGPRKVFERQCWERQKLRPTMIQQASIYPYALTSTTPFTQLPTNLQQQIEQYRTTLQEEGYVTLPLQTQAMNQQRVLWQHYLECLLPKGNQWPIEQLINLPALQLPIPPGHGRTGLGSHSTSVAASIQQVIPILTWILDPDTTQSLKIAEVELRVKRRIVP